MDTCKSPEHLFFSLWMGDRCPSPSLLDSHVGKNGVAWHGMGLEPPVLLPGVVVASTIGMVTNPKESESRNRRWRNEENLTSGLSACEFTFSVPGPTCNPNGPFSASWESLLHGW